ncbi:uncharacterized protein LOC123551595 isoform X1 [Mercenaria mercenaria]|uniref:uncharacterized protein LOC123551595 isoform X1 n=1 Tax=Mercenaria mercenaria TaxID=6596 RepID=UPI00234FADBB|nr:uncharacterized protein LOC123551595 isoform X1 [Mercenaria mercenaria]
MPRAKRQETNGSPKRIPGDTAAPPRQPAVSVPQPVDLNPQQLKVVANRVAEHLRPMFAQQRSNLADDSAAQSDGVEQNGIRQLDRGETLDSQNRHLQEGHLDLHSLANTPINLAVLKVYLSLYPNKQLADELLEGFTNGFRLQYQGPRVPTSCQNLISVRKNPALAYEKVRKEVQLGRIAGPFKEKPFPNLRQSTIGLVPKKDGSSRLIHHLSYPQGSSLNDFIDPASSSVHYTSIDRVVEAVVTLGRSCEMAKVDIKSAFRLLPVHKDDFELLGFQLGGVYFEDKALLMGCAISCCLWEKFATFLQWLVRYKSKSESLFHYLDDYICLACSNSGECMAIKTGY